jgi:hypothetical protein
MRAGDTAAHATLEDPSRARAIILGTAINLVAGLGGRGTRPLGPIRGAAVR